MIFFYIAHSRKTFDHDIIIIESFNKISLFSTFSGSNAYIYLYNYYSISLLSVLCHV